MTRTLTLAALLLLAAPLAAQPTQEPPAADAIHMPEIVTPTPAPPAPPPGTVALLADDILYLITSPAPFFVLASPPGLVTVTYDNGPQTIRGRFIESPTKKVTRRVTDKYLAIVEAVGAGRVELIVVPSGVTSEASIIRRLVDCQIAPIPPPPGPVPPAPTPPGPSPTDPFAAALQAAFALEAAPDKAKQVLTLANFYRAAALTTVRNPALKTLGDLQDTLKIAVKQVGLPAGALSKLVPVIAQDEVRALGTNRATPLDEARRSAAMVEFIRVATTLEGLK